MPPKVTVRVSPPKTFTFPLIELNENGRGTKNSFFGFNSRNIAEDDVSIKEIKSNKDNEIKR